MSEAADYGYSWGRVDLGRVRVEKRTPRQIVLAMSCPASGHRVHVAPDEVYETEFAARAAAETALAQQVESAEKNLSRLRVEMSRLLSGEIEVADAPPS